MRIKPTLRYKVSLNFRMLRAKFEVFTASRPFKGMPTNEY